MWDDQGRGYLEDGDFCTGTNFEDAHGRFFQRIYDNAAAAAGGAATPVRARGPRPVLQRLDGAGLVRGRVGQQRRYRRQRLDDRTGVRFSGRCHGIFAVGINGCTYQLEAHLSGGSDTFNNGVHGTLHVDVPAGNASGGWALFSIWTEGTSIDDAHLFAVGVHVP